MLCRFAVLSFAALLPAQTWKIPAGGVVQYDGKEDIELKRPDGSDAPQIWGYLPHARILLESELDADRTAMAQPPVDVRWLGPWIAFDLQKPKGGKLDLQVRDVAPFGELQVRGDVADGEDGEQVFTLQLQTMAPDAKDATRRRVFDSSAKGTLLVRRSFDAASGVVRTLHAELDLDCQLGVRYGNGTAKLRLRQDWRLRAVDEHDSIAFQSRVADAIRHGAAFLKRAIEHPDAGELQSSGRPDSTGEGRLALALLTLMAAGESPQDPVLEHALADLRRRDIKQTYCLALAILAIEKCYASPTERDDLIHGRIKKPQPRTPSDADRALLAEWAERLLQNRDTSAGAYINRWSYTTRADFDNSNSQYALLGLFSAQLCGVEQSRTNWLASAKHWLQVQYKPEGKPRGLQLITYQKSLGKDFDKLRRTGTSGRSEVRGFGYRVADDGMPYGSMTCGGIASLTICRAALGRHRIPELRQIDDAIEAGFAWLSAHRTVRRNAGEAVDHHDSWFYYWLYALERACELSSVRYIDGWDWYCDGANVLLEAQRHDGDFGADLLPDTCFAVLFLKKAQLPVITGR